MKLHKKVKNQQSCQNLTDFRSWYSIILTWFGQKMTKIEDCVVSGILQKWN